MSDTELFVQVGPILHIVRGSRSLCGAKRYLFVVGMPLATMRWALDEASMCRRCRQAYERQKREVVEVATE